MLTILFSLFLACGDSSAPDAKMLEDGARSADRLAFHIMREPREFAAGLAQAILDVKDKVIHCTTCYNLTESDPCAICADPRRDQAEIWVVEQPKDVQALEATGLIRGAYHVLMGHIAPLEGIELRLLMMLPSTS